MKPVLLIIDVQNEFFKINQACKDSLTLAIEYINAAITLFRKKNFPIIAIQHMNEEQGLLPGKSGFNVSETVKLEPQDLRMTKTYSNSFTKTGLGGTIERNWN
jgi:nicotinamidase-related amidase